MSRRHRQTVYANDAIIAINPMICEIWAIKIDAVVTDHVATMCWADSFFILELVCCVVRIVWRILIPNQRTNEQPNPARATRINQRIAVRRSK